MLLGEGVLRRSLGMLRSDSDAQSTSVWSSSTDSDAARDDRSLQVDGGGDGAIAPGAVSLSSPLRLTVVESLMAVNSAKFPDLVLAAGGTVAAISGTDSEPPAVARRRPPQLHVLVRSMARMW
jgi:hypothetical protein